MRPDQASTEPSGPATLEDLFALLESPLLGYAIKLVADPNVAEDIVQEAFMRLHAQFEEVRQPRPWLYRTVHNLALNHRRDTGKIVSLEPAGSEEAAAAAEPADPQPLPDEQIARWEGIGLVRLTLGTLDNRSRELLRLKFNEELSYKEISARTGLTIGNVGYILHHALKTVAEELARNGVVK